MNEILWCFESWRSEPEAYEVVGRTNKTFSVKRVGGHYSKRVNAANINHGWFRSEVEAWQWKAQRIAEQIKRSKNMLQQQRSALGQVEARLKQRRKVILLPRAGPERN